MFHNGEHGPRPSLDPMWRVLAVMVFGLLAAGIYVVLSGGASANAAASPGPVGDSTADFGFALAAGSVALMAAVMLTRPRFPRRR